MNLAMQMTLLCLLMAPLLVTCTRLTPRDMESLKKDIKGIMSRQNLWTAGLNNFIHMDREDILTRVGSRIPPVKTEEANIVLEKGKVAIEKQIPPNFDARKYWPHCADIIGTLHDQSNCTSNWAVATAAAISDRICIASYEKYKTIPVSKVSAVDLMTCCNNCKDGGQSNDGCDGGYVDQAWAFFSNHGIVTGGDYGSQDTCKPYSIAPWSSSSNGEYPGKRPGECKLKCSNEKYNVNYLEDKRYGHKPYFLDDHRDVQADIMKNGPLTASFNMCDDFPFYKRGATWKSKNNRLPLPASADSSSASSFENYFYKMGIFTHVWGAREDNYHTAVVIGWGVENGVEYWLAMNTWDNSWGENGTFRIHRMENKCNFGYFMASIPKVN